MVFRHFCSNWKQNDSDWNWWMVIFIQLKSEHRHMNGNDWMWEWEYENNDQTITTHAFYRFQRPNQVPPWLSSNFVSCCRYLKQRGRPLSMMNHWMISYKGLTVRRLHQRLTHSILCYWNSHQPIHQPIRPTSLLMSLILINCMHRSMWLLAATWLLRRDRYFGAIAAVAERRKMDCLANVWGTWHDMVCTCVCVQTCCCCCNCCRATAFCTLATYSASRHARFAGLTPMLDSPCNVAKSGFGSSEIVFFLPRLVVPGFFGPTIDDVYFMISVSGGNRTPSNDDGSLKQYKHRDTQTWHIRIIWLTIVRTIVYKTKKGKIIKWINFNTLIHCNVSFKYQWALTFPQVQHYCVPGKRKAI